MAYCSLVGRKTDFEGLQRCSNFFCNTCLFVFTPMTDFDKYFLNHVLWLEMKTLSQSNKWLKKAFLFYIVWLPHGGCHIKITWPAHFFFSITPRFFKHWLFLNSKNAQKCLAFTGDRSCLATLKERTRTQGHRTPLCEKWELRCAVIFLLNWPFSTY